MGWKSKSSCSINICEGHLYRPCGMTLLWNQSQVVVSGYSSSKHEHLLQGFQGSTGPEFQ